MRKPENCPFCGEEVTAEGYEGYEDGTVAACQEPGCPLFAHVIDLDLWNTRRTDPKPAPPTTTSEIQRRWNLNYHKARRILDILEGGK